MSVPRTPRPGHPAAAVNDKLTRTSVAFIIVSPAAVPPCSASELATPPVLSVAATRGFWVLANATHLRHQHSPANEHSPRESSVLTAPLRSKILPLLQVGSRLSASVVDFSFATSRLLIAAAVNDKLTRKMDVPRWPPLAAVAGADRVSRQREALSRPHAGQSRSVRLRTRHPSRRGLWPVPKVLQHWY